MLTIPFDTAVAVFLFITIGFVVTFWMHYTFIESKNPPKADLETMFQCPYCAHIFFNDSVENTISCPQCGSLINKVKISIRFKRKGRKI